MKLKSKLFLILIFSFSFLNAQQKIELNKKNGLSASYELKKLKSDDKKTTYLAIVTLTNDNSFDLYYGIPYNKLPDGSISISLLESKAICQTSVQNSKSLLGDYISLVATETELLTTDNLKLFKISAGESITSEDEFNIKGLDEPILTNTFLRDAKKLEIFDLQISNKMIDGFYTNSCSGGTFNLTLGKNSEGKTIISQIINSNTILWIYDNNNIYRKSTDSSTTLIYNKSDKSFNFSSVDGLNCKWSKQ